ncbi:hypothetical protein ACQBAT_10945 [Ornithinimicrobium sp. Y1847]|uniref:hypothetical protein n=1 Tax=unclassified Ornithinimicrobium TaxID=2615080 RepID=UPI003B671CC3
MSPVPAALPPGSDLVRVYRTLPARFVGWAMIAAGVVLGSMTLRDISVGHTADLLHPVALVVAVGVAGWALFLRPRVELYTEGLRVVNVVTDSVVPFGAIEDISTRWSLELLDTEGGRTSAWAVPVRRDMVPRRRLDDFAETTRHRGRGGVTAQGVSDDVYRTMQRWRLDGGERTGAPTRVVRSPSWFAVGALMVAVILALSALLS